MEMYKTFFLPLVVAFLSACGTTPANSALLGLSEIVEDPVKSSQIMGHAETRYQAGNYAEAAQYANVALSLHVENLEARKMLAKIALANKDYDAAIRHYAYLRQHQTDAESEGLLGLSYFRAGQIDQAKPFLMSSLAMDPKRWRESLALAQIARSENDLDRALQLTNFAKIYSEKPAIVLNQLGEIYTSRFEFENAYKAFSDAQNASEGRIGKGLYYRIAQAHTGRLNAALDGADNAAKSVIHKELARSAIKRADKTTAIKHLKRSIASSPKHDTETEALMQQALEIAS